jgi:hypothetical protein
MTSARLGVWSAIGITVIGALYLIVLAVGLAQYGLHAPIADPVLAVMEVLTLLSAAPIVTLIAAIHTITALERRVFSLAALAFAILFAGTTMGVHFVELTAVRQMGGSGLVWPDVAYAVELLAWDVFLGIALLLAAAAFEHTPRERAAQWGLLLSGALCLAGTVGPVVGDMRLQRIGILGYAVVLPGAALLVARVFRAGSRAPRGAA